MRENPRFGFNTRLHINEIVIGFGTSIHLPFFDLRDRLIRISVDLR
jgi:hypothetical protein